MNPDSRHEDALSRLLRRGDPAADGRELSADEREGMRRAMLRAVPTETGRQSRRLAWLAVPAMAAAGLLLAVVWVRRADPPVPELGPVAVAPTPLPIEAAPAPITPPAVPAEATTAAPPRRTSQRPRAARATAAPAEAGPAEARQLEFQTPGGTRIVWVLDPHFTLHASEATSP